VLHLYGGAREAAQQDVDQVHVDLKRTVG
jgi:hypothetical protein